MKGVPAGKALFFCRATSKAGQEPVAFVCRANESGDSLKDWLEYNTYHDEVLGKVYVGKIYYSFKVSSKKLLRELIAQERKNGRFFIHASAEIDGFYISETRGRPAGSKNKPKEEYDAQAKKWLEWEELRENVKFLLTTRIEELQEKLRAASRARSPKTLEPIIQFLEGVENAE